MVTTESKAAALLVEANPVPDLDTYLVAEVEVAEYLATLEQRSSEVTQLDTKTDDISQPQRRMPVWLIAAAVILLAGAAAVLISQLNNDAPVATQPVPTTVQTSSVASRAIENYAVAQNSGDVDAVMDLFWADRPVKRHPFAPNDFMDRSTELRAAEEGVAAIRGSGDGLEFFEIVLGDPDSVVDPDVTFSWRFFYGADGTESGGDAGCIGGKDAKAWVVGGLIRDFDWGFNDPTKCP